MSPEMQEGPGPLQGARNGARRRRLVGPADWRRAARRRLPRAAFDFIDGGADEESTLCRNRAAFDELGLVPRVLRGVADASAATTLFGARLRLPVLLAPAGNARLVDPDGELAQVRAASAAGTAAVVSCGTSVDVERIAKGVRQTPWFQLYFYRDRETTSAVVSQVKRLGFRVLVLTADAPVSGHRVRDIRNGLHIPFRISARMLPEAMLRPAWMWRYWTADPMTVHDRATGPGQAPMAHADFVEQRFSNQQTWDDLRWLREQWDGPLLLKGVLCAQDAELAVDAGCDGVIVSNHGGRQLDGVPASIEMLPEIAAAVGGRTEILLDSGVRTGTDVVKALSLGASACLIGRPWWYGLAVGGEAGVEQVLEDLHTEILRSMRLLGVTDPSGLGHDNLRRRTSGGWQPIRP